MKATSGKGRRGWWAALAGMAMSLAGLAAEGPVRVPPWFGNSAVIAPGFCNQADAILLSGEVQAGHEVRVSSPAWPGEKPKDTKGKRDERDDTWIGWSFGRREMSKGECEALQNRGAFNLTLVPTRRGREQPGSSLVLTNLIVGPVWILYVDPGRDRHELPRLTEAARRRVRVLSLPNGLKPDAAAQWVTAGKAEADDDRLFCGQPRDFANRLAEGPMAPAAIGLILIPTQPQVRPADGIWLRDIDGARQKCPPLDHQSYHQGFAAAMGVTGRSVPARRKTYEDARIPRLAELKREGEVGEAIDLPHCWSLASTCESPETALRVTGWIW